MKQLSKQFITLVLCLSLCPSGAVCLAVANGTENDKEIYTSNERETTFEAGLADDLKSLGLFTGVSGTDYALSRVPTRAEAVTMLVRLLGKKDEALAGTWTHPFTDVPAWADKYVGYAYKNGLTKGVSTELYGSTDGATANTYLTFVLRVLGYSDGANGDFTWDSPSALAECCGILPLRVQFDDFRRADVVTISYAALQAKLKNGTQTLAEKLISQGVLDPVQYQNTIDKLIFKNWSKFTRDTQADAIAAIIGRDGFVVKKRIASPPFVCEVILGELNGNPELYLVYSQIAGTGKGTGDGVVVQLPLPMQTEVCAAVPDTLSITSVTKGRSDGLIYTVLFESSLVINEGTEKEKNIHQKGTYTYFVNLNTAEVTLRVE
ncbi:MAG: hypothetical protein VB064_05370 [Oscillospiraceae bacterium]|nr:hypothetical protein [Oscillospiraceae bacterium]